MTSYQAQSPAAASPTKFLHFLRSSRSRTPTWMGWHPSQVSGSKPNAPSHAERRTAIDETLISLVEVTAGKTLTARPPRPTRGSTCLQSQRSGHQESFFSQLGPHLLTQRSGILSPRQNSVKLLPLPGDAPIDSVEEGPGRNKGTILHRMSSIAKGTLIENSQVVHSAQQGVESSSRTHQTPSIYSPAKEIAGRSNQLSKYMLQTPRPDVSSKDHSKISSDIREEVQPPSPSQASHQSSRMSLKSPQKEQLSGISIRSGPRAVVCPWRRKQQAQPAVRTEDIMHAFVNDL